MNSIDLTWNASVASATNSCIVQRGELLKFMFTAYTYISDVYVCTDRVLGGIFISVDYVIVRAQISRYKHTY